MESDGDRRDQDGANQEPGHEPAVLRLQRKREAGPDVSGYQTIPGSKPGTRTYRRQRPRDEKLRHVGEDEYETTEVALRPATGLGRFWQNTRGVLIGKPLASSELSHERLTKVKALAIFSSDALSSAAYATEEILLILILAGTAAMTRSIPISLAIAALAIIVVISYRQTIRAYPNGGGAYIVASENLGEFPGLVAGSALVVDYIMTVAVSTAAGVAAVTSAAPALHSDKVPLALFFVLLITLGNLRGIRESGTIFAIPTYFFIFSFGGMIVLGLVRAFLLGHGLHAGTPPNPVEAGTRDLTLFLFLRAFSSGAAALTGIEAVANGVPSFKAPEAKNAATTQTWMAIILCFFFVGTTVLAHKIGVTPSETKTVVAQIAETVFGHNALFYILQVATALILVLAANTAFAGLPTLCSVMARDGVMPKQFLFRGDRLAFSTGIIVLGVSSSAILVIFHADTHRIIPLYAFGVFMAFTLSQMGMIVHWRKTREPGWRIALTINAVGMVATGLVAIIVGATKFALGAWLSMAIMGGLIVVLWRIRVHYARGLDPARRRPQRRRRRARVLQQRRQARAPDRPRARRGHRQRRPAHHRLRPLDLAQRHRHPRHRRPPGRRGPAPPLGGDAARRAPRRRRVPLPLAGRADHRLPRRHRAHAAQRHDHRRPARVRHPQALAAVPAQPARPAPQERAAGPPQHRHRRRPLPPGAVEAVSCQASGVRLGAARRDGAAHSDCRGGLQASRGAGGRIDAPSLGASPSSCEALRRTTNRPLSLRGPFASSESAAAISRPPLS